MEIGIEQPPIGTSKLVGKLITIGVLLTETAYVLNIL